MESWKNKSHQGFISILLTIQRIPNMLSSWYSWSSGLSETLTWNIQHRKTYLLFINTWGTFPCYPQWCLKLLDLVQLTGQNIVAFFVRIISYHIMPLPWLRLSNIYDMYQFHSYGWCIGCRTPFWLLKTWWVSVNPVYVWHSPCWSQYFLGIVIDGWHIYHTLYWTSTST